MARKRTYIPSCLDFFCHRRSYRSDIGWSQLFTGHTLLALLVPVVWVDIVELKLDPIECNGCVVCSNSDGVSKCVE